jgi:hypothetical protein
MMMFTALKQMGARLRAFLGARDLDRDFQQELESHLIMLTEDHVRRGLSSDAAAACRTFVSRAA